MKNNLGGLPWKKHLCILVVMMLLSVMTACDSKNISSDNEWTIYWYLCGSDLESNYGAATNDLAELMDVKMPENVKVLIRTGGA